MSLPHALQVRTSRTQPPGAGLRPLLPPRATSQPPNSLGPHAGPSPGAPHRMAHNAPQKQQRGARRLAEPAACEFAVRREICSAAAASRPPRPALPGPASPLRPRSLRSPPPTYLRCWGWPGGSGARRTGGGKSRGGPCAVRSSSRPETRGCWGCRRRPGASGVPHPGAPSPASSPGRLRRRCPARLSPRPRLRGGGEGGSRRLRVPRGGPFAFWRAPLPNAGTAGPRRRPKFAPGPCLPPPRRGSH